MRYFCVVMLLAAAIGSVDVVVTAQRQRPNSGQPQADIPKEFQFLFHSPAEHDREVAKRPNYLVYEEELWKGLPYDSVSLERAQHLALPAAARCVDEPNSARWKE